MNYVDIILENMEALFWGGSASMDLKLTMLLIIVSLIVSFLLYVIKRKILLSVLIFSILTNVSFFLNNGSGMFDAYNIVWLLYFSVFIWPILNIVFIVYYLKTQPRK